MWERDLRSAFLWSLVATSAWGPLSCSGPQPLSVAMRAEDEQSYQAALDAHPESPKTAFFEMKARETGLSAAEVAHLDALLSTTRNPFDANRDPVAVSRGAVVYAAHCLRCHGEEVRGNGPEMLSSHPGKDFHAFGKRFAVTLHKGAPKAWFRKINEGHGETVEYPDGSSTAMPAFGSKLAREQIWLVISYLQSLDVYAQKSQG